jgi:1-acyl-sn-glycerol-3-phosphate acyltransferase
MSEHAVGRALAPPEARPPEKSPPGRAISATIGRAWLRAFGWKVEGGAPDVEKAVVVAAPHTTNWDLPFTLAVSWALGIRIRWVGKHTLFRFPFGPLMRALGGISVDRRGSHDAVAAIAELMKTQPELLLIIPPEGTREKADRWKTGFYYIALAAEVPIVLGYLDYRRKVGGLGHVFWPTGVLEDDVAALRAFYAEVRGKYPENESEIVFRDERRTSASGR